jgi:hypothetical protein
VTPREEDSNLHIQQLARRWLGQGLLDDAAAAAIVTAHPTSLRTKSFAIRAVQFAGVLLASAGLAGLLAVTLFEDNIEVALLVVSFAAGLFALQRLGRGHYCAGVDEGSWGAMLLFIGLGFSILLAREDDSDSAIRVFLAVTALAALVPAYLGYLLSSLISWGAASLLVLHLSSDLRLVLVVELLFALLLILVGPRMTWRRRSRQVAALTMGATLTAYVAANRFLPALFFDADPDWSEVRPLSRGLALAAAPTLTLIYLAVGLLTRRRVLIDIGLVAVVVTALTLGHELSGVAMEIVMIVVGLIVIAVTLALRSWLRSHNTPFFAGTRAVAVPFGWSREDLQASEEWSAELLSGLKR